MANELIPHPTRYLGGLLSPNVGGLQQQQGGGMETAETVDLEPGGGTRVWQTGGAALPGPSPAPQAAATPAAPAATATEAPAGKSNFLGMAGAGLVAGGLFSATAAVMRDAAPPRGSMHEFQIGGGGGGQQDQSPHAMLAAMSKLAGIRSRL